MDDTGVRILSAVLLIAVDICVAVYYFFGRRDVPLAGNRRKGSAVTVIFLAAVGLYGIFVYTYYRSSGDIWIDSVCLMGGVIFTFLVGWILNQLETVKRRNMDVLQMLIGVAEAGDPSLDGHSLNVLYLSVLLYDFLPYSYRRQVNRENLKYAAVMLDMGKLGIPIEIRNKSGKLTDEEWQMMKRHPEIGVNIMKTNKALAPIYDWVLYHHERVDGGGYYQLKGEEIPLASRIIAVADTFSAITMERPYRPQLTYEEAIAELRIAAGTQLDEELVNYFCEIPPHRIMENLAEVKAKMKSYTADRIK